MRLLTSAVMLSLAALVLAVSPANAGPLPGPAIAKVVAEHAVHEPLVQNVHKRHRYKYSYSVPYYGYGYYAYRPRHYYAPYAYYYPAPQYYGYYYAPGYRYYKHKRKWKKLDYDDWDDDWDDD